jgi:hypothetical protein
VSISPLGGALSALEELERHFRHMSDVRFRWAASVVVPTIDLLKRVQSDNHSPGDKEAMARFRIEEIGIKEAELTRELEKLEREKRNLKVKSDAA